MEWIVHLCSFDLDLDLPLHERSLNPRWWSEWKQHLYKYLAGVRYFGEMAGWLEKRILSFNELLALGFSKLRT